MNKITITLIGILLHSFLLKSQIIFDDTKFESIGDGTFIDVVDIGDIDNDGLDDVVFGSGFYFDDENDYHFFIFRQNTNGSLNSPVKLKYPDAYPGLRTMQLGDINNDNLNDIVFDFDDNIGMFMQLPQGGFADVKSHYIGKQINGLKIADLNNDNLNDIAVINYNQIFVLFQNPSNIFVKDTIYLDSLNGSNLVISDLNDDGLNDIIFYGTYYNSVNILFQDSISGFDNASLLTFDYQFEWYQNFSALDVGDMNNDGRMDIVGGIGGNTAAIVVFYQDTNNTFTNTLQLTSYDCPSTLEIVDLNCDGYNEIVVGSTCGNRITMFEQDTLFGGFFHYKIYEVSNQMDAYGLAIGDYNNDGKKDIAAAGYEGGDFLYNNSKPTKYTITDTSILNLSITIDSSVIIEQQQRVIIDSVTSCHISDTYNIEIRHITKYERYTGDSVFYQYAVLCGTEYTNNLISHFDYSKELADYTDTSIVLISSDTLVYNYQLNDSINLIDTTGIWTELINDTLRLESIMISNDTVIIFVDSVDVKNRYLYMDIIESTYYIVSGIKCGEIFVDTLLESFDERTDYTLIDSDTLLLSSSIERYPSNIALNSLQPKEDVKLYPNPVGDNLIIELAEPSESRGQLRVLNMMGEVICFTTLLNITKQTIDISNLGKGYYIVDIRFGRKYLVKKIIKL